MNPACAEMTPRSYEIDASRSAVSGSNSLSGVEEMNIDNYDIACAGENRDLLIRRYLAILRQ
jgi:hypothetical protein